MPNRSMPWTRRWAMIPASWSSSGEFAACRAEFPVMQSEHWKYCAIRSPCCGQACTLQL
jgi:hypothetical protein